MNEFLNVIEQQKATGEELLTIAIEELEAKIAPGQETVLPL